jgi:thiol-disulfide isomerase/thioredoxin
MIRSLLFSVVFISAGLTSFAQLPVPRVPVYEVFSSSTCPPCRPANEHMTPIFKDYDGELAIVKYQMSWPGSGDPYYTTEGNSRRSAYGVSSVPALFRNSNEVSPTNLSASMINNDLEDMVYMDIQLRYLIDTIGQSVRVRARIEAMADYTDGGHRVMIPIVENLTTANKKSNGEKEFHNVFKKMLPGSNGELIVGEIDEGDVIEYDTTYTFQGGYRLPPNSLDPIDNSTEHSVEEFDDLHVVMFVQSLIDKDIYQGAVGEREYTEANMDRDWGSERVFPLSVREFNQGKGFAVYPNPSNDVVNVRATNDAVIHSIDVVDVHGRVIHHAESIDENTSTLDVLGWAEGIYTIRMASAEGIFQKRLVVSH